MDAKPFFAALVLAGGWFSPLAGQQPSPMMPGPMGQMGDPMGFQDMMGPMMHVLLYTPQHLLARKEALGLTNDQIARLSTLRNGVQTGQNAAMAEAKGHVQAVQEAAAGATPDTVALKTHFEAAHAAMGKAHWLALVSAVQAKAVLTDGQRTKVKVWADSMQAWMQQHRQMMQPHESH
ncbi:MAG: hypothetical protein DMD34_01325 [Gemmatimonadetes bacterium]|nr:MAG: hypothetical protein DMD46_05045 [Gemmatimonadota bacterium]PYP98844.1 MAG: hypothetical protein DMD34_01325 [Gemmatimonadota bacterium]